MQEGAGQVIRSWCARRHGGKLCGTSLRAAAVPHIVNVASITESLTLTTAPGSPFAAATDTIAYASAKAALVMLTMRYATAFAGDLNGHSGPRTAEQGAKVVLDLIARGAVTPTGAFLNEDGPVPW